MTLRLTLQSSHLSIRAFPTIDIPDFTLVIGRNGSGKTHLLESINQGRIVCDKNNHRLVSGSSEIRSYSWTNMVPQDTGGYSSENSRNEKIQLHQQARNMLVNNGIYSWMRQQAIQLGLNQFTDQELASLDAAEIDRQSGGSNGTNYATARDNTFLANEQQIRNSNSSFGAVLDSTRAYGKSIFGISEAELLNASLPNYGRTDLFQQSFARLFVEYRDMYVRNELHELAFRKGNRILPALNPQDFSATHGVAPWDFVNTSLKEGGLDFQIDSPALDTFGSYQPRLTKVSTGDEVQFANLSSGEKILMSFAFCIYYATDNRQIAQFPKLLLLDEIDAPLHPAMTRGMIRTISDVLVAKYNISVIMTSHSPSTVALYSGDSVCIMQDGRNGLKLTAKNNALNLLTEGVPTLSLSYSGRRQVFVESNADAETYPKIYEILKRDIQSERSLEFISTGVKDASGVDRNTGCTIVNKLVKQLVEGGNTSTFGLVDWDGKHQSTERILVLAEGHRNGLENVILDPLILAAFLCHSCRPEIMKVGVPSNTSYVSFINWPATQLQPIVTKICQEVLGRASVDTVTVEYIGGITLRIEREYLVLDDHELERKVIAAFKSLNAFSRGAGKLMQRIVETVVNDKPDWVPLLMKSIIVSLLEKESHF